MPGTPASAGAAAGRQLEPGKGTDVRGWQNLAAAEQEISAALERGSGRAPAGQHPLHPG